MHRLPVLRRFRRFIRSTSLQFHFTSEFPSDEQGVVKIDFSPYHARAAATGTKFVNTTFLRGRYNTRAGGKDDRPRVWGPEFRVLHAAIGKGVPVESNIWQ